MGGREKSCCLLGALLVTSCFMVALVVAEEDQPQTDTPSDLESIYDEDYVNFTDSIDDDDDLFEKFLHKDCQMERIGWNEEKTIALSRENNSFRPVVILEPRISSIRIHTDSEEESYGLNLTNLPGLRPLASRFDVNSSTFHMQLSPLVSVNLTASGVNDTIGPKDNMTVTFKGWLVMTTGNCTNGLPFYKGLNAGLSPGDNNRMELILLSTQEGGDSAITGAVGESSSLEWFSICSEGDGLIIIGKGKEQPRCVFSSRTPHYLTLHHDSRTNETMINDIRFTDTFPGGSVWFDLSSNKTYLVLCLGDCPKTPELNRPQGNTTKDNKVCVLDIEKTTELSKLIVYTAIILFTLMVVDGGAMIADYVRRRFFYQPPEQDPNNHQWHLNIRPLPFYLQPPPPLPEQPSPALQPAHLRRRRVMEEEEEEDSD